MELHDKVVVVTGASMGIGAAAARAFARAGARVGLAARSEGRLAAIAREIGEDRALAVPTDVADRGQVDRLAERVVSRFGRLDVLVNNAAVGLYGAVDALDLAKLEDIFAVNVLGPLYALQAAVPHMRRGGGGVIVNVSSMTSKLSLAKLGAYRATKRALDALTDSARLELAADNIRVITAYPGVTDTGFFENTKDAPAPDQVPGHGMPSQTPEFVADRIVAGVRAEPREIYMGARFRVIGLVGTVLPAVFERLSAVVGTTRPRRVS